ncbi:MAG: regulator of ribonuclease activity A [Saprospiraceae bacterium]|jgi:regulator of ribonuclease activity A
MKTADLVDDYNEEVSFCDLPFKAYGQRTDFYGEVQTIKCFEDNALLKAQLQTPGNQRVMVVDAGASSKVAVLGDLLAEFMRSNGWAGIIINGAIRDSEMVNSMDVGVVCLGTSPKKSSKKGEGVLGSAVHFGDVTFESGNYVYCDADGVLVSSQKLG